MSFPRYESYKDSGVEWLGDVPEHWEIKPLKKLAYLTTGLTPPTDDPENYSNEDLTYPWIRPEDINETGMPTMASKFLSEKGWKLIRSVKEKSSIICCIGTIGKVGFIEQEASTNQQITAAIFVDSERYHYYSLYASRRELEISSTGNVVRILNSERLGAIYFPYPTYSERNAIASFLDRETAKIDDLIAEQQRLIALLTEKRQAIISHAVTKGLNPDAPMKDSGVEWLGEVPKHWEVRKLSSIITKITNGYVGPTRGILVESGIRYLQSLHIKNNKVIFNDPYYVEKSWSEDHSKSILKKGDVVIVQTGDIGQVAVISEEFSGCNCHALIIVSPKEDVLAGEYLSWVLDSDYGYASLISIQTGALHPHLNCGNVRDIYVPIPPLKEQGEIVNSILKRIEEFELLTKEAQRGIILLQERRSALISAAVTGKIDVRGVQPVES